MTPPKIIGNKHKHCNPCSVVMDTNVVLSNVKLPESSTVKCVNYAVSPKKTRHHLVTIIGSNSKRFHSSFTAGKSVKFSTKLPTTRKMLPHYLEKVKCSNLIYFCTLSCVPIKMQLPNSW